MENNSKKYQHAKVQYAQICNELFANFISKFPEYKNTDQGKKDIEEMYFTISNFVKAIDELHSNKSLSSITNIDIKSFQSASMEAMNISKHIRELSPDRKTNFKQYDVAKILLEEYVNDIKNVTAQSYEELHKQREAISKPDNYVTKVLKEQGFKVIKPDVSPTLH